MNITASADNALFKQTLTHPNHVLSPLLPEKVYHLCTRKTEKVPQATSSQYH